MAEKKTTGIERGKINTLNKLKDAGYDTAAKIKALDGREIYRTSLTGEMGNIFELQDAIKANHSELAWLMDGEDPKPAKREEVKDALEDGGNDNRNEGFGYSDYRI